jgi:seryl-tRNA synthetase
MHSIRLLHHFKRFSRHQSTVAGSCQQAAELIKHKFHLSEPVFDEKFLFDEKNIESISENIKLRKGVGDIHLVHDLKNKLNDKSLNEQARDKLKIKLQEELKKIPNWTHPDVKNIGDEPKVISYFNEKPEFKHKPLEFSEICKKINLLRMDHLGNFAGHKTYYLMSDLADLVS